MARRKLPIGELGTVRYTSLGHRKWRARGQVRTYAGVRVQVQGTGRTKDDALAALRANANLRVYENAAAPIDGNTHLIDLLRDTLTAMRTGTVGKKLRIQSVNTYERQLSLFEGARGDEAIGNLPLNECTKNVLTHWLMRVGERTPANAKLAKVLLSRAYDLSVMQGIGVWDTNPTYGVRIVGNDTSDTEPVALTLTEIQAIWANVQAWQTPNKRTDLLGIVAGCMATGFRPTEVLGLQWSDLNLSARPKATATLTGAIVRQDGHLVRQGYTKTKNGYRVVYLPDWFRDMLIQRAAMSESLLVFPNDKGGFLDVVNIRTRFREARGPAFEHVKLKSFRSSVATAIANASSIEEAARQLGHSSPAITAQYYRKRAADAGDHTAILELFAPAESCD